MSDKIKVLQVMNGATHGGISTVVLNYYKNINREKCEFDLALYNPELGHNGKQFVELGSQIFILPLKSRFMGKYIRTLYKILKKNEYHAVHVHNNNTSFPALMVARFCKVEIRIAHAHTAQTPTNLKEKLKALASSWLTPIFATTLLACSNDAGRSIFGERILNSNKYKVLPNAIDINKFKYNEVVRNTIREKLGLEDYIVIGNVGNLGPEKNHQYLLQIMAELCQRENRCHLLIVGTGELLEKLKQQTKDLGIKDNVSFLGHRSDVNELLQAMDVFVMPSLFEGFAIAGLEACTSGLPTFLSDNIPSDLDCFENAHYLSIKENPSLWAEKILQGPLNDSREKGFVQAKRYGFDISDTARELESIYLEVKE